MAEALARQVQLKNDATKMAMKIPIFHGSSKDDTMDIVEFLRRFEASAEAMNLVDQPEKCNIFSSYLRGNAAKKWEMMTYFKKTKTDWASVKEYFMKAYKGEIVPDTIIHKIQKLQQEKGETVNDFGHRCAKELFDVSKKCPMPDVADQDAAFLALTAAQQAKAHANSVREMSDMFAKAFFLNGIKDALKVTVMNAKPVSLQAAIEKAMEVEQTLETANSNKSRISELAEMEDGDLDEIENLDEDDIFALNKKRAQYGRQPFKKGNRFQRNSGNSGNGNSGNGNAKNGNGYSGNGNGNGAGNGNGGNNGNDRTTWTCRYCNKPGHLQKFCNSRIAKGAPLIDKFGKTYTNAAAAVADQKQGAASVSQSLYDHVKGSCGTINNDFEENQEKIDLNFN